MNEYTKMAQYYDTLMTSDTIITTPLPPRWKLLVSQ